MSILCGRVERKELREFLLFFVCLLFIRLFNSGCKLLLLFLVFLFFLYVGYSVIYIIYFLNCYIG